MGNSWIKNFFHTKKEQIPVSDLSEFHKLQAIDIKGNQIHFETFKDKKLLLIVNVASK
jgi:hypothetical protein